MSQQKILNTLQNLGLSNLDAQVYLFLGKKGPKKASELVQALKIPKQQLYAILKNLQSKGIVNSTLEHPARFTAERFEKILEMFVNERLDEVKRIEAKKDEILSDWNSISIDVDSENKEKFTVLERNSIHLRLKRMISEAKDNLLIISSIRGLIRAEETGLFDFAKSRINVKFLTEISANNLQLLKNFLTIKRQFKLEGRVPDLGLRLFTRIIIRDGVEAVFFLSNDEQRTYNQETDICLWTNCKALVDSFTAVFQNLWATSTDVSEKITETKSNQLLRPYVISNSSEAELKCREILNSAEKEILMIGSPETLSHVLICDMLKKKALEHHLPIKILTPISGRNLRTIRILSGFCEIRHMSPSYIDTIIIDKQRLFQFKPTLNKANFFENSTYIDDIPHVEKAHLMVNSIWKKSYAPYFVRPDISNFKQSEHQVDTKRERERDKAYAQAFNFVNKPRPQGALAEKDILDRILNAKRQSTRNFRIKGITLYGSVAQTFIHKSDKVDLPDMMIQVFNNKPQSSFGAAILLLIYLKIPTTHGFSYEKTVSVSTNQGLANFLRIIFKGTPIEKNSYVFRRGEIEVREQSNTLFLGWTKPIPLPEGRVLPPCGLLFEGYGDITTRVAKIALANGWQGLTEGNTLEAFTNFYYSSSKLSIPGTEGFFLRDHILTYLPPVLSKPDLSIRTSS